MLCFLEAFLCCLDLGTNHNEELLSSFPGKHQGIAHFSFQDKTVPIPEKLNEWVPRPPPEFVRDVMGTLLFLKGCVHGGGNWLLCVGWVVKEAA